MNKINEWIRNKIRTWLGITGLQGEVLHLHNMTKDLVNIGVDVHLKSPHMVLIYSRLNGGCIRHIDADFKDMRELNEFVKMLKHRYNTSKETWDLPPQMKGFRDHR